MCATCILCGALVCYFHIACMSLLSVTGVIEGVDYSSANSGTSNGAVYRLPLYLEDWVDQVMERLFTLLSNLDTGPSHRGTDQQAKPELLLQSTHLGKVRLMAVLCWMPQQQCLRS